MEDRDPYEILREAASVVDSGYRNSPQMLEDFRGVFLSTPQGKRVFHQIMDWAGILRTAIVKGDPYATHVREGEKNIGARVWAACVQKIHEQPTTQSRKR